MRDYTEEDDGRAEKCVQSLIRFLYFVIASSFHMVRMRVNVKLKEEEKIA